MWRNERELPETCSIWQIMSFYFNSVSSIETGDITLMHANPWRNRRRSRLWPRSNTHTCRLRLEQCTWCVWGTRFCQVYLKCRWRKGEREKILTSPHWLINKSSLQFNWDPFNWEGGALEWINIFLSPLNLCWSVFERGKERGSWLNIIKEKIRQHCRLGWCWIRVLTGFCKSKRPGKISKDERYLVFWNHQIPFPLTKNIFSTLENETFAHLHLAPLPFAFYRVLGIWVWDSTANWNV